MKLSIALLAALLLGIGVYLFAPWTSWDQLTHNLAVEPTPEELACKSDDECVRVVDACACSLGLFIHRASVGAFEARRKKLCEGYQGPICGMRPDYGIPFCEKGRCSLRLPAKASDCERFAVGPNAEGARNDCLGQIETRSPR
ncbi:MAG TPA: hypothetical protein VM598_01605 [Bdellovibrionota bacterium]|nr:hypothetical protein [Bdellovibrionota bacterium]